MGLTLVAFALTASIGALRLHNAFDLFQATVFIVAWYGGMGPALLASGLSILTIDFFFIPPLHTLFLSVTDLFRLAVFGAVALLTSSISARLRQTQIDLQRAHDDLEVRVLERTGQLSEANHQLEGEIEQRLTAEREILQISSREQRRLSEDLHDGLCQTLAGLRLLSQGVIGTIKADRPAKVEDIERIEKYLGEAVTQADLISQGLYPVELEADGLMRALEELAEKASLLYRAQCQFKTSGTVLISSSGIATHLYRIAQEALTNAIKHGKASRVTLRLFKNDRDIMLSIIDNGTGLQGPSLRQGMGIKMMTYRAHLINAEFRIRSRARGVTRVTCMLPIEGKEEVPD